MRRLAALLLCAAVLVLLPALIVGRGRHWEEAAGFVAVLGLPPWLAFKGLLSLIRRRRPGGPAMGLWADLGLHALVAAGVAAVVPVLLWYPVMPPFVALGAVAGLAARAVERAVLGAGPRTMPT